MAARLFNPNADASSILALVSLSQTDAAGRFVLENLPPGRYQIVAGSVELPTFYPGTPNAELAQVLEVASAATIENVDFQVSDASLVLPKVGPVPSPVTRIAVPILVVVEGGSTLPSVQGTTSPKIRLTPSGGGPALEFPLEIPNISVPVKPGAAESYRVQIDNPPAGYFVKSMTFNFRNLLTENLEASVINLSQPGKLSIPTWTGRGELQKKVDRITANVAVRKLVIVLEKAADAGR